MRTRNTATVFVFSSALVAVLLTHSLAAQVVSGRILATVVDATGSSWPKANVAVLNTSTMEVQKAIANLDGSASFDLPEGQYVVIAADPNQCIKPAMERVRVDHKAIAHTKLILVVDRSFMKCGEPIT